MESTFKDSNSEVEIPVYSLHNEEQSESGQSPLLNQRGRSNEPTPFLNHHSDHVENTITAIDAAPFILSANRKYSFLAAALFCWLSLLTFLVASIKPTITHVYNNGASLEDYGITISTDVNGTVVLNAAVNEIRLTKGESYDVTEVMSKLTRRWSAPILSIYVGDIVTWHRSSNENIVSCNQNGVADPAYRRYIDSALGSGLFTKTFDVAGTYYYISENSQTLNGVVVVKVAPAIRRNNGMGGALSPLPSGIQTDIRSDMFSSIDGCWQLCAVSNDRGSKPDSNWLEVCDGDYFFLGVSALVAGSNFVEDKYTFGAFGKYSAIQDGMQKLTSYGSSVVVTGTLQNGIYWYNIESQARSSYPYLSIGFSSSPSETINWSYGWIYDGTASSGACSKQVSIGFDSGNTYYSVGCSGPISYSQQSSAANRYIFEAWTSTCPVLFPPDESL